MNHATKQTGNEPDEILSTSAEIDQLSELIPAASDGYTVAFLYGLRKRPARVELFNQHGIFSTEPTVYIRTKNGYKLREVELI